MQYKFRGKRKDNGEWVYGAYVCSPSFPFNDSRHFIIEFAGIESGEPVFEWHEVIAETVGMWTGLKDKKGVEIYEGDVLGQDCNMVDDYSGKHSIEVQKLIVRWDSEQLQWTVFCPDAILQKNWGYIPRNAYVLNPAQGAVINSMNNINSIDPGTQQAEEVKEQLAGEATNDQLQATEQQAQEEAMESAEEGSTEG